MLSIVILTRNRVGILLELLDKLRLQSYKSFETIVVDNGSTDNTVEIVTNRFPFVNVISLSENLGCGGRNVGIKKAQGEVVITLDDDILFKDKDALAKIDQIFCSRKVYVVNFIVLYYYTKEMASFNWYHPKRMDEFCEREFETNYITEGAVAFRRTVFEIVGYYPDDFFIGHEGLDLAYRLLDNDFKIIYNPNIEVFHKHSVVNRQSWRGTYYETRNYIWLIARHFPLRLVAIYVPYRLFTTFVFSLSRLQIRWYFKAIKDAFLGVVPHWQQRKPLQKRTLRKLADIRRDCPNIISKIKDFARRHKARDY